MYLMVGLLDARMVETYHRNTSLELDQRLARPCLQVQVLMIVSELQAVDCRCF